LTHRCDIMLGVDTMYNNRGIKASHICVRLGKCVPIFLEEGYVGDDFFMRSCSANGDFFYDSGFDGNVDFDGGGNIGHIAFFESIRGRDRVFETIYMS
jgi:hypothetical protein